MADDSFEEMCCALLAKEPDIVSADLFGRPRERQYGIDVIGQIAGDEGIEVISCKCRGRIRSNELRTWSDDFLCFWDTYWIERRVRRFIIAVAADIKSSTRNQQIEAEKARFSAFGITYEPWSPRLLQEKLRSQPGIVAQFLGVEWVSRLCGTIGAIPADPTQLLNERWAHSQACEFEKAVACAESAAQMARDSGDKNTLRKSLRCAARDLGDHLISKRFDEMAVRQIASRIAAHIAELETLDMPEAELALEKALFARLEKRGEDALNYARAAEQSTDDPETVAEALLVQLQAHWQTETLENGLKLKQRIYDVTGRLKSGDSELVLGASWLRTLRKASKSTDDDVSYFINVVQTVVSDKRAPLAKALVVVDEVVTEFGRANDLNGALALLELALGLATTARDSLRAATIAIQIAEVNTEMGNAAEARQHLGIADKWIDALKSNGNRPGWAGRKLASLVTRGRIEARLARQTELTDYDVSIGHRRAAYDVLSEAMEFMKAQEADIVGDVEPFRADLSFRLGEAADALGRHLTAARHYHHARSDQIMADERFRDIGTRACMRAAKALLLAGRHVDALSLLGTILETPWINEGTRTAAQRNIHWIDEHVVSIKDWFKSDPADNIRNDVICSGLRPVIAEQMQPIIKWFSEFPPLGEAGHAYSELYDIWGRGGLSRIVAAVRSDPLNSISVDATSLAEIRLWARVFCPLYDTVLVNWKGPLYQGFQVVPMPDNLGPPGEFGGQGYIRTAGVLNGKEDWHAAVGWGNFLPKDVSEFLATEALALVRSGRIVLIPAPLVGCTQSAVGWCDNLFVDTLLGGVVKTAVKQDDDDGVESTITRSRLLDLGSLSVPFIDNIPLNELNLVLDDTGEWLAPLRRLLQKSLGSSQLRHESWDGLRPYFSDIRDAFRELKERWGAITAPHTTEAGWFVGRVTGAFSAATRGDDCPSFEPMTDLLRAVTTSNPDLGPWVPFWRLHEAGGRINWTKPLDNPSTPPDEMARLHGFRSTVCQGWLFPGDGGPGMATAFLPTSME
jgi:tetratricopeptide (TPR) repeat protein